MSLRTTFLSSSFALLAFVGWSADALAQWSLDGPYPQSRTARASWEQRVLKGYRGGQENATDATVFYNAPPSAGASQSNPRGAARPTANYAGFRTAAATDGEQLQPMPMMQDSAEAIPEGDVISGPMVSDGFAAGGEGCATCGGEGCGGDDCGCDDCGFEGCCGGGIIEGYILRNIQFFAGVHGFKGPVDLGRNGNFGMHEGLNFGAPLGDPWGYGYQLGFEYVHSNFKGDLADGERRGDRDQVFFTGGIFRRAPCGGLQWGVVYDVQQDMYYNRTDLKQIRSETSFVLPYGNEIGYFGAYGTGGDNLVLLDRTHVGLEPTDMFCFFYRRHFETGGEGRFWGGLSGRGDGLLGADFNVPLGRSWALVNRINYLIPKEGPNDGGQARESWGLMAQLVWYPGRRAACEIGSNPFRPLFDVADNSTFMVSTQPIDGANNQQ